MARAQRVPVVDMDPNALRREIGRRLAKRRVAVGMSQAELAHRIGVTFQQLYKYEQGKDNVSMITMLAICAALNFSPVNLIKGLKPPPLNTKVSYGPTTVFQSRKRKSKALEAVPDDSAGAP